MLDKVNRQVSNIQQELKNVQQATSMEGYKAKRYRKAESTLLGRKRLVVRGPNHPMGAYVVLPEKWTPKKTWPLFVAIVGANCSYRTSGARETRSGSRGL